MTEQSKIVADPGTPVGSVKLKKIGNSTGFLLPKEMMTATESSYRRHVSRRQLSSRMAESS